MNYKHLHDFLQVAETGSVAAASRQLHMTPQTISGQTQLLAERLGGPLLEKAGRRPELTDTGRLALGYAPEIFSLGAALEAAVRQRTRRERALEIRVAVMPDASPSLKARSRKPFPDCPLLMPGEDSAVGPRLRAWFNAQGLSPRIVAQFDDSALAQEFGRQGAGYLLGLAVLADEIEARLQVRGVGTIAEAHEDSYAISVERRITHPCVLAITRAARSELFRAAAPSRRPARWAARSRATA